MKTILGVMVFRSTAVVLATGQIEKTPVDRTNYNVAVDRGVLVYHDFKVIIAPIREEGIDPIVINLKDVFAIEHGLVMSPCKTVKKGRTVFWMHHPAERGRPLTHYCLKMTVDDHHLLHDEIRRTTKCEY